MNPRSCQLCGKPLSRLRVGSDGDFCSKEHRNQFRLRAGMDRLVEVNKVANLMRRRESAKQLPPSALICNSALGRRGFMDAKPAHIHVLPRLIELRPAAATRPRITAYSDRCLTEDVPAVPGAIQRPRTHPAEIRLSGREMRPAIPERRRRLTFSFPRTGATAIGSLAAGGERLHRDFRRVPQNGIRVHLGGGPQVFQASKTAALVAAARLQSFKSHPVQGNALRVSTPIAFRVPQVQKIARKSGLHGSSTLQPVARPRLTAAQPLDSTTEQRSASIPMPDMAATLPAPPRAAHSAGFPKRGAMRTSAQNPSDSPARAQRPSELPLRASEPRLRPSRLAQAAAGFSRRNGAHLFKIPMAPNAVPSLPQLGTSPFIARDEFVVPKVPFRNVLAAATSVPSDPPEPEAAPAAPVLQPVPVPAPEPVAVKHEEHFDAGWDNWIGGVADWKVDIAGVRTGSLALFLPTLELSDYDLEFLARIDTRTVNWVVRAAGRDTYLQCTLTAIEGGQVEFSRALVKSGTAETPVISSQRAAGKPRTAMTVRMSVAGPVFSVSVDGKTIDSWVDDRLATGGVGFMGAADDRARIYWVRVSSPAAPSKEYTLQ
jgi:hypothetical protein